MQDSERPSSLTDLLGGLASDISGLFRKEIQLAKTEATEKLDHLIGASQGLAVGALLAIGAIGVFLSAVVTGLSGLLLAAGMSPTVADFVSPLIVSIVVGIIAWMSINRSLEAWKSSHLNLDRTSNSLARDAKVMKESF